LIRKEVLTLEIAAQFGWEKKRKGKEREVIDEKRKRKGSMDTA